MPWRDGTTVALVGAGPGDPELLTLRAARLLAAADVVLYDHLVGDGILDLCAEGAERIDVGKIPGGRTVAQEATNALLLEHARRGRRVVRLKGGDPFVFGRGGEEVEYLARAGIACEVVPGISSALAAPAAAGIPVTHRGVATHFSVVTASGAASDDAALEARWAALAGAGGTLVFLMGVARAERIQRVLIEAGRAASTPCAVVQEACTPRQRAVKTTLGELASCVVEAGIRNPAVIVVGEVVDVSVLLAQLPGTGSPAQMSGHRAAAE
jgi:uroporphyrin-III C-methyltransferase/precorrin-2 dehydrogenase/sirohydrochlorin ferrochelatase